jgi:hypothetical protein
MSTNYSAARKRKYRSSTGAKSGADTDDNDSVDCGSVDGGQDKIAQALKTGMESELRVKTLMYFADAEPTDNQGVEDKKKAMEVLRGIAFRGL